MHDKPLATRRQVMLGSSVFAAAGLGIPSPVSAARMVKGCVFHDRSGCGHRRAGDPGVANVLVSNGVQVVSTDRDGNWRLPAPQSGQVFVIKPSGWGFVRGPLGLPKYSQCVPVWRGMTASSGDIESDPSIEFGLRLEPDMISYQVALVADTQPQSDLELDYLRDSVLAAVAGTGASFAINHGDIVFDDPALYPRYLQLTEATGLPWYQCPGNHDMNAATHAGGDCFETWQSVFGPTHYAFQQGRATFIVLNNVERLPAGPVNPSGYGYRGCIGEKQLAFIRNVLAHVPRDDLIVLSMHIPLVGFEDPDDPSGRTADCRELLQILSGRPHTVSFAGHTHTTEHHYLGREHGFVGPGLHHHHVLTAASGSWWSGPADHLGQPLASSRDGTPKGFHLLSVDGNKYESRLVTSSHSDTAPLRIGLATVDPKSGSLLPIRPGKRSGLSFTLDQLGVMQLVVNVFDGGPKTDVSFQLQCGGLRGGAGGVATGRMQRMRIPDPYTIDLYSRFKGELKSWVEPSVSSHVWCAPLPVDLRAGVHRVVVTVKDEYGRLHSAATIVETTELGSV